MLGRVASVVPRIEMGGLHLYLDVGIMVQKRSKRA